MTWHAFALRVALGGAAVLLPTSGAAAQIPGIDAWAQSAAQASIPRWIGQRVTPPEVSPRPAEPGLVLPSSVEAVAVHAGAESYEAALEALVALEHGALLLRRAGWAAPLPDGGRGGTPGFDLYLVPGTEGYAARDDGAVLWTHEDGDAGFAVIDPSLGGDVLASCAVEAYADVVLLGLDPAEAPAWRRATAAWLAWMVTGRFGCDDGAVARQATEPWRSPVPGTNDVAARDGGAGGALFLAFLDARESTGTGVFVRDAWQFARQRTWEGWRDGLRGAPDLTMTLARSIEMRHEQLSDVVADLAVLGAQRQDGTTLAPAVRAIPYLAAPPLPIVATMPTHLPPTFPPIDALGGRCVRVDVSRVAAGSRLRVWMDGEWGVVWSLVALRRDAAGAELGRVTAPPRWRNPRSYVAVEPLEGAHDVLVCVANLGSHGPDVPRPANAADVGLLDADRAGGADERSFRLTFDVVHD